jgi:membrane protease YdiL (CAAX protease family)
MKTKRGSQLVDNAVVRILEEVQSVIRKQPLLVFGISTFLISWILWYFAGAYNEITTNYKPMGYRWLLAQIGVFAPALCAMVVGTITRSGESINRKPEWILYILVLGLGLAISRLDYEEIMSGNLATFSMILVAIIALYMFSLPQSTDSLNFALKTGPRLKWFALSMLLAPALMIVSILIANGKIATTHHLQESRSVLKLLFIAMSIFAFNLLLGGSVGEEPGWRGFALPILLSRYTPWIASLILSLIWSLWHAPLDISHGFILNGIGAVLARILWTLPLTLLFTYFFMRTNGSMLIAVLLHTSVNFSFEFFQPSNGAIGIFSVGLAMISVLSFARI